MKKVDKSETLTLRQKAEELLKKKSLKTNSQLSETDILRLNHELQVHQIELEMQNEELKLANEQAVERNQAEETLKESEERFRTLFENSTIGIYRTTPDGQILLANPSLIKLLGYSSFEELVGRNLVEVGFEPSYERTHFMDIIKREGEVKGLESAWTRMDGTTLFISESARGVNDKAGKIIYYDGIVEDITLRKKAEQELIIANKELTFQITERKQSELALRETDNKYMGLVNLIPVYIAYVNANTLQYEFVNDLYEKSFGIPREKIIGSHMQDVVGETNYQIALKYINEVKSGKSVSYENTYDIASGKRWIQVNYSPVFDDFSKVIGIAIVNYDITERIQATDTLRKLSQAVEQSPVSIIITDTNGIIEYINPKAENTSGYKLAELIGKNPRIFNSGEKPKSEYQNLWDTISSGNDWFGELHNKKKNGELYWERTSISPIRNTKGEITHYVAVKEDITEQKAMTTQLLVAKENEEKSEETYRTLFESISDAVIVTQLNDDKTFKYLNVNDIACKMYGYTHEEFLTKTPNDIVSENSKKTIQDRVHKILNNKYAIYEIEHITKDGKIFPVEISSRTTKFRNNTILHSVIRDISERKQAELLIKEKNENLTQTNIELIKAKEKAEESDRLKSAFLTNMSHEIRTPMNGIIGFTELLKEPHLTVEEQQDFIQTIQISGARMLNTINSIVDMSKIESGLINVDIKETNLNEKIEFTYKFFKPEVENKGLQFFFKNSLSVKEAIIKTDNEKVYGILTNLVRNAIKFTYEGSIEFGYEKKGEYLEFFVKDTGIGIPQNQHDLIFERFRQGSENHNRGYEGSGLGLSICKSYVEMLGGRIWVESEEDKGSTFYFTIPYNPVSEETHTIENDVFTENKEVQLKTLKILIVEDDEISYSLLSRVVQKISKEVLHAMTGVQAIEACRNNPDIDLVLMDIRMPVMNGLEATSQIRQFNKDLIIIAETAYGFSGDKEKAMEAGCNDYISKPINKTLLYELIKKHINK